MIDAMLVALASMSWTGGALPGVMRSGRSGQLVRCLARSSRIQGEGMQIHRWQPPRGLAHHSGLSTAGPALSIAKCSAPPTVARDDLQKESAKESVVPEQWENRLAHTMMLRTVQNTMRHAHQLLQLLTKRYGTSSQLHISCWEGNLEKVASATGGSKAMVQKCHSRQRELAPLHISALCGHASVVEYLLQLNAAPDLAGVYNYRALHIAASSSLHISQLLLQAHASPTVLTDEADTPLHLACCYQQLETIELLLQATADPSAANNFGVTPLHVAAATAALEGCDVWKAKVVLILVRSGSDIFARDRQGKTPAAIARIADAEPSLVSLLEAENPESFGLNLPGSPSHAAEAPAVRVKRWAAALLTEDPLSKKSSQACSQNASEPSKPSYAELELENEQLKSCILELQHSLDNAEMNVKILRDSLDLQALSTPLPKDDSRLAEIEASLKEACARFEAFDEERKRWRTELQTKQEQIEALQAKDAAQLLRF
eukprot:symbB.v1.2.010751.t1/scaffold708.1/size170785/19